jgi:hypothetical protein
VAVSEKTATVRIWLSDQPDVADRGAVARVYTSDLALIGEAALGESVQLPLGQGYVANAVSSNGQALGLPESFDLVSDVANLDLHLKSRPRQQSVLSRHAAVSDAVGSPRSSESTRVLIRLQPGNLRIWELNETPPNDGPPEEPEKHQSLAFPGPDGRRRYALVPFDFRDGAWIEPRILWSTAKTQGYVLPDFEFGSPLLAPLQEQLRNRQPMLARAFASRNFGRMAEGAVSAKLESALAAVLGGLVLLDEAPERLPTIEPWTQTLFDRFPRFPDALPLRVDLLAKLGRHREAQDLLRRLPERGVPWTRRGLRILAERLQFYHLHESDKVVAGWTRWAMRLLAISHPACVFCVFEKQKPTPPTTKMRA